MINEIQQPLTVSQLNRQVKCWLEQDIGLVHVAGELSNLSKPASGHYYFTLKDEHAQLRAVFFQNYQKPDAKMFANGQQVIARGKLSLYEARGEYQLIVNHLSNAGIGELYQQFELLKTRLEAQGLFALHKKKAIPLFPRSVAVITSESGAALRDILTTLKRRYPVSAVCLYPCEVQGKKATAQLIQAIKQANIDKTATVILLARGGGSIEDLWCFNDEYLALAISNSQIPIITGIGHETDFTIADFVADLRAATPTAAAEAATPDRFELLNQLVTLSKQLHLGAKRIVVKQTWLVEHARARISSPALLLAKHAQTLDYLERHCYRLLEQHVQNQQSCLQNKMTRLTYHNPLARLKAAQLNLGFLKQTLHTAIDKRITAFYQAFKRSFNGLTLVSPLATLDRGYALALFNEKIITHTDQITIGDQIEVKLAVGSVDCKILNKKG